MYYLINSPKGPVRFHAVGEPIVEIPADPESGIRYERNGHYVTAEPHGFVVWRHAGTHAKSDSTYPKTADGESIARARVDYLAGVK